MSYKLMGDLIELGPAVNNTFADEQFRRELSSMTIVEARDCVLATYINERLIKLAVDFEALDWQRIKEADGQTSTAT